jgi:hypothetical protein
MTSNKKDLYNLVDGWLELESDPGLFTLLLEDMGVVGVQVRESETMCCGSGIASKNLSIFNPKNCFSALGKMIWDVHPGSRFFPSRTKGSDQLSVSSIVSDPDWIRIQLGQWIRIRIRNPGSGSGPGRQK